MNNAYSIFPQDGYQKSPPLRRVQFGFGGNTVCPVPKVEDPLADPVFVARLHRQVNTAFVLTCAAGCFALWPICIAILFFLQHFEQKQRVFCSRYKCKVDAIHFLSVAGILVGILEWLFIGYFVYTKLV